MRAMRHDLHSHSWASDGLLSPAQVVRRAAARGVEVLALTDHDTTAGLGEAARAAEEAGVRLVPGVEISVTWHRRTIHIVGLGIDPECPALAAGLERLCERRRARARAIDARLARHGIEGAYEGARRRAAGAVIGRGHLARFLVEAGHVTGFDEAFKRYLGRGRVGFAPGEWVGLAEAVGWIRAAGGQAVIAHPARYRLTSAKLRELIREFRACGGEGIEVVSSAHSREEVNAMTGHARRFGLLASCGSDFHDPANRWADLGRMPALPAGCEPVWRGW